MSVHVTYGSGGGFSDQLPVEDAVLAWSETLATAGTTTATVTDPGGGEAVLTITAYGAPAWIAVGPVPNAGANPRRYLADGVSINLRAKTGDKVAWAAVT